MLWLSLYLLIGALCAAFTYVVVAWVDKNRDAADTRDSARQMETAAGRTPGGMLTILIVTVVAWPAAIVYAILGAVRNRT